MSNNKPLPPGPLVVIAVNQQQGTVTVSMQQAAAALQNAAMNQLYQAAAQQNMHSGLQQMQQNINAQMNQINQAAHQLGTQSAQWNNIWAGSLSSFWDVPGKYTVAELKLAIGKKIKIAGHKMKLLAVDDEKVTVNEGMFFTSSIRDYGLYMVDEIPLIDKMYETKLGKLSKL